MRKWYKIWVNVFIKPVHWYWPFTSTEQYMVICEGINPVEAMQQVSGILREAMPGREFRGTDIAEIEQPDLVKLEQSRIEKVDTELPPADYHAVNGAELLKAAHEKRDMEVRGGGIQHPVPPPPGYPETDPLYRAGEPRE